MRVVAGPDDYTQAANGVRDHPHLGSLEYGCGPGAGWFRYADVDIDSEPEDTDWNVAAAPDLADASGRHVDGTRKTAQSPARPPAVKAAWCIKSRSYTPKHPRDSRHHKHDEQDLHHGNPPGPHLDGQ